MHNVAMMLSIKQCYIDKIFDGLKTVELRRNRPVRLSKNALVLIYSPSPEKSLVGAFFVDHITEKPTKDLWKVVENNAGITHDEYIDYFQGTSSGIGVFFSKVIKLNCPVKLDKLREKLPGFHPPQAFRYLTLSELESISSELIEL